MFENYKEKDMHVKVLMKNSIETVFQSKPNSIKI